MDAWDQELKREQWTTCGCTCHDVVEAKWRGWNGCLWLAVTMSHFHSLNLHCSNKMELIHPKRHRCYPVELFQKQRIADLFSCYVCTQASKIGSPSSTSACPLAASILPKLMTILRPRKILLRRDYVCCISGLKISSRHTTGFYMIKFGRQLFKNYENHSRVPCENFQRSHASSRILCAVFWQCDYQPRVQYGNFCL